MRTSTKTSCHAMVKQGSSTKTTHAVQLPYSASSWPTISTELESSILNLLLPRITPIGDHRRYSVPVSTGHGRKKRPKCTGKSATPETQSTEKDKQDEPDVLQYLTVGFNSTVRNLELLAQEARSAARAADQECIKSTPVLSAVFVCVTELPEVMTAPLPLLIATASLKGPSNESIRLIPISAAGAERTAHALCQPKASILGIVKGAPGFDVFESTVEKLVNPVDVPWIGEAASDNYLPVKIHTETRVSHAELKNHKRKRAGDQGDESTVPSTDT